MDARSPGDSDDTDVPDDTCVAFRLGRSCYRALSWEAHLPVLAPESLTTALRLAGFAPVQAPAFGDKLLQFETEAGHRLLWVPASGRCQLRLSYLTLPPDREAVARQLGQRLGQVIAEASA